jgi:cell division protease FtsH
MAAVLGRRTTVQTWGFTDLVQHSSAAGEIARARIEGERVFVDLANGSKAEVVVPAGESQHAVVEKLAAAGIPVEFTPHERPVERIVVAAVPPLAIASMVALAYATYRRKRVAHVHHATGKGGDSSNKPSFDDVAGIDEVKGALAETIEFLRDPTRFGRLGARAPRGILLAGPPGTGKTLLARAAAAEANVPFLSASGSGFQEMFAGVGASRVRSLFTEARKLAPCIVFVDEIDALGKRRGRSDDSAGADADQTLNQLLIEMDGFDPSSGIVILASTNRPDVLDSALLRPGRFDRQIVVGLPDAAGREAILRVHARRIVMSQAVDFRVLAKATPGYSGADLARLLNEAAILAAREGAEAVETNHLDRAGDKIMMGDERPSLCLDAEERYATAVHEAGHVAVGLAARCGDPIHKVSILPRGRALGITQSLPERDRQMYRREYLEDRVAMLLGGRAAEQVILGTMTAGASDDIEKAVELARKMVAELGMSSLGPIHVSEDPTLRSPAVLDAIEKTTTELVKEQLTRACDVVRERRSSIDRLVAELLERDTLVGTEIRACFADAPTATQAEAGPCTDEPRATEPSRALTA